MPYFSSFIFKLSSLTFRHNSCFFIWQGLIMTAQRMRSHGLPLFTGSCAMHLKKIFITETDKARLEWLMLFSDLFKEAERITMRKLNFDVSQACVVRADQLPADVVTTHSQVILQEVGCDREFTATLVFPEDEDEERCRFSVLTTNGKTLLGSRTGDIVELRDTGGLRRLIIKKTSHPGQAAGRQDHSRTTGKAHNIRRANETGGKKMLKLYKNLASGRLFIGINEDIEEIDAGLLLITPEGKIKRLEEHLFEQIDAADDDRFVRMLTAAQRDKHREVLGSLQIVD
jgi:regulator of nucleoside diphosphate kinase